MRRLEITNMSTDDLVTVTTMSKNNQNLRRFSVDVWYKMQIIVYASSD